MAGLVARFALVRLCNEVRGKLNGVWETGKCGIQTESTDCLVRVLALKALHCELKR